MWPPGRTGLVATLLIATRVEVPAAGYNECTCKCCESTLRRPTQQVLGQSTACSPLPSKEAQSACGAQCQADPKTSVVTSSRGYVMDYGRYCLYNCEPDSGNTGATCSLISEERRELLMKGGDGTQKAISWSDLEGAGSNADGAVNNNAVPGNGALGAQAQTVWSGGVGVGVSGVPEEIKDPNAPPEPPQLVDEEALEQAKALNEAMVAAAGATLIPAATGSGGAGAAPAAAGGVTTDKDLRFGGVAGTQGGAISGADGPTSTTTTPDTGAFVADAAGNRATAASLETRMFKGEAVSAKDFAITGDALKQSRAGFEAIIHIKAAIASANIRTALYARSAEMAENATQEELREIQEAPSKFAREAANEAVRQLREETAAAKVRIAKRELLLQPAMPAQPAEASTRAAAPYYDAMQQAVVTGTQYEAKARRLEQDAWTATQQSRTLGAQAAEYQNQGLTPIAQRLHKQAEDQVLQAQALDTEAARYYAVAEKVHKDVPVYQANAAAASARAAALAYPLGQPTPPRPTVGGQLPGATVAAAQVTAVAFAQTATALTQTTAQELALPPLRRAFLHVTQRRPFRMSASHRPRE